MRHFLERRGEVAGRHYEAMCGGLAAGGQEALDGCHGGVLTDRFDVGACDLVIDGSIKLQSGKDISHLTENATFVCSGILREREDEVTKVLTANGYQLFDRMEKGDWVALAARVR